MKIELTVEELKELLKNTPVAETTDANQFNKHKTIDILLCGQKIN